MKRVHFRATVYSLLLLCGIPLAALSSPPRPDVLLQSMQHELERATRSLAKSDPAPYFLSYAVSDGDGTTIAGTGGGIIASTSIHRRTADVMMRVGSSALDNTHSQSRPSGIISGALPLRDDPDAIARVLWLLTDREYEQASSAFLRVKTNQAVQSAEEDKSPDFSQEKPQTYADESSPKAVHDLKVWEDRIRGVSARFLKYP
jgi:TldD protein